MYLSTKGVFSPIFCSSPINIPYAIFYEPIIERFGVFGFVADDVAVFQADDEHTMLVAKGR